MEELHAAIAAHLRRQDADAPRRRANFDQARLREMAIYARVAAASPDAGAAADLEAQVAACWEYARQRGRDVRLAYREVADGDTLDRPRLEHLSAFIAHGWIATVLVTTLDRLSPDPALLRALRAEWMLAGVAIIAVMDAL